MQRRILACGLAAALWIWILMLPGAAFGATALEDGTYTASYLVLRAENDSVSMANDYWEKPATITVKDGKATVRLTLNHSKWVTEYKVPGNGGYVDTKIIVTNQKENKRVVEFAADVSKPILSKIHVTVAEIDYDHDYTIRMVFDPDSFKLVQAAATAAPETAKPTETPAPSASAEPAGPMATQVPSVSTPSAIVPGGEATAQQQATPAASATPDLNEAAQGAEKAPSYEGASPAAQETAQPQNEAEENSTVETSSEPEATGITAEESGEPDSADAAGTDSGGEVQQPLGEGPALQGSVETLAAPPLDGTHEQSAPASSATNWRSPLIIALLLLVGGAVIIWRRKARGG